MNNISQVKKNRTIAIWCIPQSETKIHGQVCALWNRYFKAEDSFWLEIDSDVSLHDQMDKLFQSSDDSYLNASYNVSIFYDFRKPVEQEIMDQLNAFHDNFQGNFYGSIAGTTHFGYVEKDSKDGPSSEVKRQNCLIVSAAFPMQRVLMVEEFRKRSECSSCWDPIVLFIDIQRRDPMFLSTINKEFWVGYMKYRSYDAGKRRTQQQKIDSLEKQICDDPEQQDASVQAAKIKLNKDFDERKKKVEENYSINGAKQPMHPDLNLSGITGPFACWKKRNALKPGGSYEFAARSTTKAVEKTASELYWMIKKQFSLYDEDADKLFVDMVKDMGLSCLASGAVKNMIRESIGSGAYRDKLDLNYSKTESCEKRIETYLNETKDLAVADSRKAFCEALLRAADRHEEEEKYAEKLIELKEKVLIEKNSLNAIMNLERFCTRSVLGNELEGMVSPFTSLSARRHRVCLDLGLDADEEIYLDQKVEQPHYRDVQQVAERINFLTTKDDPTIERDAAQPLRVIEIWLYDNMGANA